MKLWLDDQWNDPELPKRHSPKGWIGVATIEEAKKYILEGPPNDRVTYISFDNDLGEGIPEGYELASWLEECAFHNTLGKSYRMTWDVHSANPVRAKDIATAMTNADKYWDTLLE